jgi:hypothetical protein
MSTKRDEKCIAGLPMEEEINGSLERLSGEVEVAFAPVQARPAFREYLGDGLQQTMRHKRSLRVVQPGRRHLWALIAGATLGSLISLCGVAAYVLRSRLVGKPQHATYP